MASVKEAATAVGVSAYDTMLDHAARRWVAVVGESWFSGDDTSSTGSS